MTMAKSGTLPRLSLAAALLAAVHLGACSSSDDELPQLTPATAGTLLNCTALPGSFSFPNTAITAATLVAAGTLSNAGQAVGAHCLVTGRMNQRVSSFDGQTYAIGFEMRLPVEWGGRLLYQGNGGTDGVVVTADGGTSLGTGGLLRNGLQQGFAVISSDAGHSAAQNPLFGRDPQARLDYGYQAVGTLTPMAKALVTVAYGRPADRSYIAGTSNGGRHALVAAARYGEQFDGVLATAPGINLPRAATANIANVRLWDAVATTKVVNGQPNFESALPLVERQLIANAILARCDALDGLADGLVNDVEACRSAFSLDRDVPTCTGARNGTCLTLAQKAAVNRAYNGPRTGSGELVYSTFPFDPGLVQNGWADWKFRSSVGNTRNPVSVAYVFSTPPLADVTMATDPVRTAAFAVAFDLDAEFPKLFATSSIYPENSTTAMTPPTPGRLDTLRSRGGKVLVAHGLADPIFSADDTAAWWRALDQSYGQAADRFVRYFAVPGMGHSRGGPATDQMDLLSALVEWVERGRAPDRVVARARGAGNAGGVNSELPSSWSANRTRLLCPYPLVPRFKGGDPESADSFACER